MTRLHRLSIAVLTMLFVAAMVFAEGSAEADGADYPTGPITLLVPFRAGGGMDTTARTLSTISQDYLGVPLVVVNRTGASGTIAVTEGSNAEADGYTLLMGDVGTLVALPLTQEVDYSVSDFEVVSGVNVNDVILVVHSDSQYQSVEDLANATERVRYGTVGRGSILHALATAFFNEVGVESTNVPFGSTADTVTAVLGKSIDVGVAHPNQARTGLADGTLRAIGVFSNERVAALPDVPTMPEFGYDIALQVYNVLLVPAGVPADRLEFLRDAFVQMLNDPVVQNNAASRSLVLWPVSGTTAGPQLVADNERIEQIFTDIGVIE